MNFFKRDEISNTKKPYLVKSISINQNCVYHWHSYFEIIYVLDGELVLTMDLSSYTLKKDDFVLIAPGIVHDSKTLSACNAAVIQFSSSVIDNIYNNNFSNILGCCFFQNKKSFISKGSEHTRETIAKMVKAYNKFNISNSIYVLSGILELLSLIADDFNQISTNDSFDSKKICNFIEQNATNNLTLKEAAKISGYTKTYFSKKFKDVFGLTFKEYVDFVIMSKAQQLILAENKSVTETALALGYDSVQNFSRAFKRTTGFSPRKCKDLQNRG